MNFWKQTNKKWALSVTLLLTVCALIFGCDSLGSQTDVTPPATETTGSLVGIHQLNIKEEGPLYMLVGDSLILTTDAPDGLPAPLTWSSSSPAVGITQQGVVTAQVTGSATVTVEYYGFADSIEILVVDELPSVPVETSPSDPDDTSSPSDPADTDPADPVETDPSDTDSTDPAETDPADTDSTDPAETDPADTDSTDPAETDPADTDSTDPAETDPADTDPTDPAETDPADTDPTDPAETDPAESETEPTVQAPPTVVIEAERSPAGYRPAGSYQEALDRTQKGELSGYPYVPDQAPIISDYRPMQDGKYIKNNDPYYIDENTYVVVDAYGREVFRIYRGGAYISLEEVAAYVWAFGDIPANHSTSKKTSPASSIWGEYLRVNHTVFSGSTSKYPYEPELPRISGCGGDFTYYEMDIGTTGTDCDPSYAAVLYNNGYSITRGAARIVYARFDRNGNKIIEPDEKHVFYTYNHYNDFQEYLNYYGGWGEMFGNITGGGTISSKYDYNPTPYVPVVNAPIATRSGRILSVLYAEPVAAPLRMEATVLHCDFHRYRDMAA